MSTSVQVAAASRGRRGRRLAVRAVVAALVGAALVPVAGIGAASAAPALPDGFTDTVLTTGLATPTVVQPAADGRIFVAEKAGKIKVLKGWDDPTPTVFADLTSEVYDDHDRGLLGMTLAPDFPTDPSVYVLYSHQTAAGSDGHLSRLKAVGHVSDGTETLLVQGWCEQYDSHSIGALAFGPDGALYASGGDGASYNSVDVGDFGNPCQDPPTPGSSLSAPDAQGGALRSQSLRRPIGPVLLNGTVIRIDPATGEGRSDNPLAGNGDANARRIIAYGLRNPYRFALRPGTKELYVGETGWNTWEEVNRIADTGDATVENFGWPCYEGAGRQGDYDSRNLTSCETLYAAGPTAVTPPLVGKYHGDADCAGGNSQSGVAFTPASGGTYPAAYAGALFYADYARSCISVVRLGANGQPDPSTDAVFEAGADGPISLATLANGDLVYTSYNGSIHRIGYRGTATNRPPTAAISADPTSGATPLKVTFNGGGSTDPEGGQLTYAWDLDGDGTYDDATTATATRTYTTAGKVTVRLRVTDPQGATDTASVVIDVGATPPSASITAPTVATVGDTVSFSGTGTSGSGAALPASAYAWSAVVKHCKIDAPTECHEHPDAFKLAGQTSGSFVMPDHERIAYLELRLTVTDDGRSAVASHRIDYTTSTLSFASQPAGIALSVGGVASTTPFTRVERVKGTLSIGAPDTATVGGKTYRFSSWSDGGAAGHNVTVPAQDTTYTAVYTADDAGPAPGTELFADGFDSASAPAWTPAGGTWAFCQPPGRTVEYCVAGTDDSTSLAGDATWTDYSVEAAVTIPATAQGGHGACVLARVQDAGHYYQLELRPDPTTGERKWFVWKRDGGAWTEVASGPFAYAFDTAYRLRLTVKGSTLSASVSTDGTSFTPLGSGTDTQYTSGRIGLRSWGAATTFDAVRVLTL